MTSRMLLVLLSLGVVSPALADFSGRGEFGLVVARGNSDTETSNARLELVYERERWTNESTFNYVYARDSGETSASRFVLGNKTDYSLNDVSYVVGALRYDRDRFSAYEYQGTVSVGYGRRLIQGERHTLKAEIGPGFRFAELRETNETENEAILRGFLDYRWQISETAKLTNRFLVESGQDNTFMENALGLTVAINSRISLKTGVAVRHNTEVDPGRKNTDTLTTVNMVYNFGARN
jgi:putative salt-induced outer membrane protein